MRNIDKDKFGSCLEMFSKKRWGVLLKTSFGNVLECSRRGLEEIWQRQVLNLSKKILEEKMRNIDKDKFWNCFGMFSKKRWGILAKTSFEIVLECSRRRDEEIWQRQILKLSKKILEEKMNKFGNDKFWNCLRTFSKRKWGNFATTSFEIVLEHFRRRNEGIWQRQVFKMS